MVLRWTGIQRSAVLLHCMVASNGIHSAPQKTEEERKEEGKGMRREGRERERKEGQRGKQDGRGAVVILFYQLQTRESLKHDI